MSKTTPALSTESSDPLSSDSAFDGAYDRRIRELSEQHWTPVRVAARAAYLLTKAGATRILDVGSGVGKFCIVGALTTQAQFVGVERREHLVAIARQTATRFNAERATFVHAAADTFSFEGFNGIYLYNPFYEQISKLMIQIDEGIERSSDTYRQFVGSTVSKLATLAPPVAILTYNGFGGVMPSDYTFSGDEPAGGDRLELWVKR
jgi:SAM-dependent methyltransferase